MTNQAKLKAYLKDLGKYLKPLPEHDIKEILAEIESLALEASMGDATEETLDEVLEELGKPKDLAENYRSYLLDGKRLPLVLRVARGTAKGASRSLKYFAAIVGYGAALVLIIVAIAKPFFPEAVGIWYGGGDSFIVGSPGPDSSMDEVMGYWLIPFGLVVGGGLFFLTQRIMKFLK